MKSKLIIITIFIFSLCPCRANAQNGILDTSGFYPSNGYNNITDETVTTIPVGGAIDFNKRIVFANSTRSGSSQFNIRRLLSNGGIDTSFHYPRYNALSQAYYGYPVSNIGVQNDGKILIVDHTSWGEVRLNYDGTLDTTYRYGLTMVSGLGYISKVSSFIRSDGKIVRAVIAGTGNNMKLVTYRLNNVGNFDSTYGTNGVDSTHLYPMRVTAMDEIRLSRDGKFIVEGAYTPASANVSIHALFRFNADGTADATWGVNGIDTIFNSLNISRVPGIIIDTIHNKTYIPYAQGASLGYVRLNDDGTLDNSFGINGRAVASLPGGITLTSPLTVTGLVLTSGRLLISTGINCLLSAKLQNVATCMFKYNGLVDSTFGTSGWAFFGQCISNPAPQYVRFYNAPYVLMQQSPDDFILVGETDNYRNLGNFFEDWSTFVARYKITAANTNVPGIITKDAIISIFPNPTNSAFSLSLDITKSQVVTIVIHDLLGRIVDRSVMNQLLAQGKHSITISSASWPSGNYFVTVYLGDNISTRKLLKQ